MRVGRIGRPDGSVSASRFLTRGAIRLGILCAFIAAVEMASPRISTSSAGTVFAVGVAAIVLAVAVAVLYGHRWAHRPGEQRSAVVTGLRHTGLPLLGLGFFLVWTIVYIGLWWYRPDGAFGGLGAEPRFADFFYYSVSTGLISPPGDIIASSRGARAATLLEMITALALVTAYLSSFTDFLDRRPMDEG